MSAGVVRMSAGMVSMIAGVVSMIPGVVSWSLAGCFSCCQTSHPVRAGITSLLRGLPVSVAASR